MLKNKTIQEIGLQFASLVVDWDNIAVDMWQLSVDGKVSSLPVTAHKIRCAHDTEYGLLLDLKKECLWLIMVTVKDTPLSMRNIAQAVGKLLDNFIKDNFSSCKKSQLKKY